VGDLQDLINSESLESMLANKYVEPLKTPIDNTASLEALEQTRQAIIGEREERNRSSLGGQPAGPGQTTSKTTSSSSSTSTTSTSTTSRGWSGYTTTKVITPEEKAKTYANKIVKSAVDKAKTSKPEWDIVSAVNNAASDKKRSASEIKKDVRNIRVRKLAWRALISLAKTTIEILYLKGGKF